MPLGHRLHLQLLVKLLLHLHVHFKKLLQAVKHLGMLRGVLNLLIQMVR